MSFVDLDHAHILQTYKRTPLSIVSGEGCWVTDIEGKRYLDFLGGIAVNILGHCHPAVVQAVQKQCATLMHCSNLYYTEPGAKLAAELAKASGLDRFFFCNSGAEANEGAFKLVRKATGRPGIVALSSGFHGRTLATLAATDRPDYRAGMGPMPEGFNIIPAEDVAALDAAVDHNTAAVILEAVQGEGGVRPLSLEYQHAVRRICTERGALLVADEVQCGVYRTGRFLGIQVKPDVITLAKGLGGGLPIGAFGATEAVASGFKHGDHGSTFGANPVACAAALAVLHTIQSEGLAARAVESGKALQNALREALPSDTVVDIRGEGLMVGVELAFEGAAVVTAALERGLIVNCTAGRVIRLLPPLTITSEEIVEGTRRLAQAVEASQPLVNQSRGNT